VGKKRKRRGVAKGGSPETGFTVRSMLIGGRGGWGETQIENHKLKKNAHITVGA